MYLYVTCLPPFLPVLLHILGTSFISLSLPSSSSLPPRNSLVIKRRHHCQSSAALNIILFLDEITARTDAQDKNRARVPGDFFRPKLITPGVEFTSLALSLFNLYRYLPIVQYVRMMASSEIKTKFSIFVMSDREVDYSKFSSITFRVISVLY